MADDDIRRVAQARTDDPPYHLVNQTTGKHLGPFSTLTDALLASQIAAYGDRWISMSKAEFDEHLKESRDG